MYEVQQQMFLHRVNDMKSDPKASVYFLFRTRDLLFFTQHDDLIQLSNTPFDVRKRAFIIQDVHSLH